MPRSTIPAYHARARRRERARPFEGRSMQVIGGKNRPEPLLEPGVDFLQERGIDQAAGERVIDTQYDFVPGVATRLNGRKYVGENTVRELGKLIGLVDAGEAQRIQTEFDAYKLAVSQAFESLRGITSTIDHVLTTTPSASAEPVQPTPPDAETLASLARAQADAEATQIQAAEAALPSDSQEDDVTVKHLTGAERTAVERQVGPLREVGDRGDLVDVPDEHAKVVAGTEEISGLETAKAVYNRGVGAGEAKADELATDAEKTDAAQDSNQSDATTTADNAGETGGR